MSRSQTATEYLVIIGVVIIIAVIVVGILGGIPSIGSNADKQTNDARLATLAVGISEYAISDYDTTFTLRNNRASSIIVTEVEINGELCTNLDDFTLVSGKSTQVVCQNVFEAVDYSAIFSININYTDKQTNAVYSQNDDLTLISPIIGEKYLSILDNTPSFNSSIKGCWNWTELNPQGAICTCVDLNKTKSNQSTLYSDYFLQNNIDFARCQNTFDADFISGEGWVPIGSDTADWMYNGTFDGQNNYIRGLRINRNDDYQGLFGDLYESATSVGTIRNLSIVNADVSGTAYVGGLVGYGRSAEVSSCSVLGVVVVGTSSVGGLMGYGRYANISNSHVSRVTMNGTNILGGLVGYATYADVSNSYVLRATIYGTSSTIGGLVGTGYHSNISNSYVSSATVTGTTNLGGFMGFNWYGNLSNNYVSNAIITGTSALSGFLGSGYRAVISNSYVSNATVTGTFNLGGLMGYNRNGDLSNSYVTSATVTGTTGLGGLIGYGPGTDISNSYILSAVINGTSSLGGLTGDAQYADVSNSYATARVFCTTQWCGGLVGRTDATTFTGTNTWTNYSNDNATGCVGQSGTTDGLDAANCAVS